MINYSYYRAKPSVIKNWYSINLELKSEGMTPIPLGLSNNYSPKNLLPDDFENFKNNKILQKEKKLYLNFNPNTNFSERDMLYGKFKNLNWVKIEDSNLSKESYHKELSKYKFSLAPWGNGVDTHRIWESLYVGTIPITKYHHTFSTSTDLPILFVNDYEEVSISLLDNFIESYEEKNYDFNKLENKYWINLIQDGKSKNQTLSIEIKASKIVSEYLILKYKVFQLINRYIKILFFYIKKLKKLINLAVSK